MLSNEEISDTVAEPRGKMTSIAIEKATANYWTSRARPSFLYVMCVIVLFAIPIGVVAAFQPDLADRMSKGMNGYLSGIPDALWGLFGTCYLGYTAARQWGKVKGVEK